MFIYFNIVNFLIFIFKMLKHPNFIDFKVKCLNIKILLILLIFILKIKKFNLIGFKVKCLNIKFYYLY